jgi:fructokinase
MLVDFTKAEIDGEIMYKQNAGGAPANVAVMAAKLGVSSGFIGKVGKDMFGKYLKSVLTENKVNTDGLIVDSSYSTSLAFVEKKEDGEREFVFYRNNAADANMSYGEVRKKLIDNCKILHFGSLMLTHEPSKSAAVLSVEYARQQGKTISYDPNWRENIWSSKEEAIRAMQSVLKLVDIVKVSEEELQILTDCGNMIPAIAKLFESGIKVICITQGAKGCIIATRQGIEPVRAFKTNTVDTLGAGDSFFGAFLSRIVKSGKNVDELDMSDLTSYALYANACGALSSTKYGAIPAMPTEAEILDLMENGKMLN